MRKLDFKCLAESIPYGEGCGLSVRDMNTMPPMGDATHVQIDEIDFVTVVCDGDVDAEIDLDADYQRGHVWTDRQASLFVGHVLGGGLVQPLIVQRYSSTRSGGRDWVALAMVMIDGKQRYMAFRRWIAGEIDAEMTEGVGPCRTVRFRDLTKIDRRFLPSVRVVFVDLTYAEQIALYLRLNAGGTPHSSDEIERVRGLLDKAVKPK